jgi:cell division GTPase FtsZ
VGGGGNNAVNRMIGTGLQVGSPSISILLCFFQSLPLYDSRALLALL